MMCARLRSVCNDLFRKKPSPEDVSATDGLSVEDRLAPAAEATTEEKIKIGTRIIENIVRESLAEYELSRAEVADRAFERLRRMSAKDLGLL